MRNEIHHYIPNSCITSRYHFIDIKIEKSPFPIRFVHRVSDKTDISFLKIPDLNLNVFNIRQSKIDGRLLLAKNDRDKRFVKSCRQILLLNVDTKILSKSLAKKLKHALPELISSNQTTYCKNRCISKSLVIVIY